MVVVASFLLMCVGLVAIFALLPAFISSAMPLLGETRVEETSSQAQKDENRKQISSTRTALATLVPYMADTSSSQVVISKVYALRPSGVEIETIRYTAGSPATLVVTGVSDAREPVNDYRTKLVSDGSFENVSVPVAALVGALDGRFTMTLTGSF
jgi:Tfp pilus assembly protein PilN